MDEVLALWLSDERLELGSCEGVDQSGLRNNKQQDLSASEDREFVSLYVIRQVSINWLGSVGVLTCAMAIPNAL